MPQLSFERSKEVFASTARTANPTAVDFTLDGENLRNTRGCLVFINCTAIAATPSVTFTLAARDDVTGVTSTVLTSAAVTGVSTKVMKIHPDYTAAADIAKDVCPPSFRISATHGDADSITYQVSVMLLP